jgi:hypothetical protein
VIGCSKTHLSAHLKYSEISVTRHMAEKNAASALQSSDDSSRGGATASICTIARSLSFEAMVVGDARVFGEDVVADVVHR